ncbi:MAG TPA: PepSY domain-containing protein [Actinocatenispora sp.]
MRKPSKIAILATITAGVIGGGATAALATDHDDDTSTAAPGTAISRSQAERAAKRTLPGATVTDTDLDREHGRTVWEIDLTRGGHTYEVHVDATTGVVTRDSD